MGDIAEVKQVITKKPFSIFKLAIYYFVINFSLKVIFILIFQKSVDPGTLNSLAKAYLLYDINRHIAYSWKKKIGYSILAWVVIDIVSLIIIFSMQYLLAIIG